MTEISDILDNSAKLEPARQKIREGEMVMPNADMHHGMRIYTMGQLMAQDFPDELWVVDGLIPEGITVMSAQPASFKTWLLLSIAISVASGDMLFEHFVTDQTGVLMIDEENSTRLLQQRLKMLDDEATLPIHFMIEQSFKLEEKQITRVIKFCEENNIRLVTFDSLIRIHKGNENDSGEMAAVFANIRRFTKAGINVLITHHNRKSKDSDSLAQSMRGSSDILASVDCHIAVTREDSHRLILTQTKVRFSEEHEPVEVEIVTSEDSMNIKYAGTLKPSESKKSKLMSAVREILIDHIELNQGELLNRLEEIDNKVSAKTLRKIIDYMIANELLLRTRGTGNEWRYKLGESELTS